MSISQTTYSHNPWGSTAIDRHLEVEPLTQKLFAHYATITGTTPPAGLAVLVEEPEIATFCASCGQMTTGDHNC